MPGLACALTRQAPECPGAGDDREAAERALAAEPPIALAARANRAFLGRVVPILAAEAGIGQFLDVGTGIPTADNTHQVAQRVAPQARVVYADNGPIVLAHARALLASTPEGEASNVDADARDTATILRRAANGPGGHPAAQRPDGSRADRAPHAGGDRGALRRA
jgi:hypothetical protein